MPTDLLMHSNHRNLLRWTIWMIVFAFLVRIFVIGIWPDGHQFDAYQRWAGREHLYVQVWLPVTQSLVWMVGKLGGTPLILRVVFSLLGACTIGMAMYLSHQLSTVLFVEQGAESGEEKSRFISPKIWWVASIPIAIFGPYVVWSSVPYQESTLLFFLFAGLIVFYRNPRLSDILIGTLALVRYEGWPLIAVYWLFRRNLSSLVLSSWGILLWLSIRYFGWLEPFMASPDSFSDWKQLEENLNIRNTRFLLWKLWVMFDSSAASWYLLATLPMLFRWRQWDGRHWMLFFAFWGQMVALSGWLFSLGVAFSRMIVLPLLLVAPFSIAGFVWGWQRWDGWKRVLYIVFMLIGCGLTLRDMVVDLKSFNRQNRWERSLVKDIERCTGDVWSIYPRIHTGPRSRHDGCEVVQGLTNLRAGIEFNCVPWGWGGPDATLIVNWDDVNEGYEVDRISGISGEDCPY